MTRSSMAFVVAATLALAGGTRPVRAQFFPGYGAAAGNIEGINVTGKGSVSARPNRLEIDLEVSASSELTADAIVKYRDAKKRLQEAFAGLKLDNVTVEERGLLVDQKGAQVNPYFFDGMPNRRSKVEVQLTRKLVVKCSDIRKMDEEAVLQLVARLLDVAQDAGGRVGESQDFSPYYYRYERNATGLVRFILDDYDKIEEEAYAKAVADAEARAQRLAKLSRVKLGPVTAIREASSSSSSSPSPFYYEMNNKEDEPVHKRLESKRFQEIPVRVELLVRFDVAANPGGDGRAGER